MAGWLESCGDFAVQGGVPPCRRAIGDLSDTVREQTPALCSWNSSTACFMQEVAAKGCYLLSASVTFVPGRYYPWHTARGKAEDPIYHHPDPRQDVSCFLHSMTRFQWAFSCCSARRFCRWKQWTAKACQPQAACESRKGSSIPCYTKERRNHEGGKEWAQLQPGWIYNILCSCPLNAGTWW